MISFGEIIKKARKDNNLILRRVGNELDIDKAILSKFERGERNPTKEQVEKFANFYRLNKDELVIAWLSDKITYNLKNEKLAEEALKVAEQKIKYQRTIKSNIK